MLTSSGCSLPPSLMPAEHHGSSNSGASNEAHPFLGLKPSGSVDHPPPPFPFLQDEKDEKELSSVTTVESGYPVAAGHLQASVAPAAESKWGDLQGLWV